MRNVIRAFFRKIGTLISDFWKRAGETSPTPPSSYAPGINNKSKILIVTSSLKTRIISFQNKTRRSYLMISLSDSILTRLLSSGDVFAIIKACFSLLQFAGTVAKLFTGVASLCHWSNSGNIKSSKSNGKRKRQSKKLCFPLISNQGKYLII